jgi:hypothetical protein
MINCAISKLGAIAFCCAMLLSSCATLVNTKHTKTLVQSNGKPVGIKLASDTAQWHTTPYEYTLKRSRADVVLLVKRDSAVVQKVIRSKHSGAFWIGNLLMGAAPFTYLIDLSNDNRFTYPPKYTINTSDTTTQYARHPARSSDAQANKLSFVFSLPQGNNFYVATGTERINRAGFLGITAGLQYQCNSRIKVAATVGTITDFPLPFPAPLDRLGGYKKTYARYAAADLSYCVKDLTLSAGLQVHRINYVHRATLTLFPIYNDTLIKQSKHQSAGLSAAAYYKLYQGCTLGLRYLPGLGVTSSGSARAKYSHLLFLELRFDIGLWGVARSSAMRK